LHANKTDTAVEIVMEFTNDAGEIAAPDAKKMAELKNERGNELYIAKKYQEAIPLYTEAIELCPDLSEYYGNRSACYIMLYQYEVALEDARKAVALDRSFVKGYIGIAKCSLALGDVTAAINALLAIRDHSRNNSAVLPEVQELAALMKFDKEGTIACRKEDYIKGVFCTDRILEQIPCTRYKLKKVGCLILLGRFREAHSILDDILHIDTQNAEAVHVRGVCFYYQGNMEQAICQFKYTLQLAPNHQRALTIYKRAQSLVQKKEEGNKAYIAGKLKEAYSLYTEALEIDPKNKSVNAKLFFDRATVCSRLGRFNEAVADFSSALKLDDNYWKALLQRAKCYMELSDFEKAVSDYEKVVKMDSSRESRRLLEDAKLALKKSKHKDYYKIFGVDKNATIDEIKKAYKRKALSHHPDRHVNASDNERREHERKFQEVAEAYGILSDREKRACYDRSLYN
jgi:DnaJ family protein C protein 7